jgi:hypothetical protein
MGLCSFGRCSEISSLLWWSDCIYISSYNRAGVLILLSSVMVSLILPYSCRNLKSRYQAHIRYIKNIYPRSAYALHILNNRHKYGNVNDTMTLLKRINTPALLYEEMYMQSLHHNNELIPEQRPNEHNPMFQLLQRKQLTSQPT